MRSCSTLAAIAAAALLLLATGICSGQDFPLRPGEWEAKTEVSGQPTTMLFCFTNETWRKGLTQNPICKVSRISVTSAGVQYALDCEGRNLKMKGTGELIFDGMEHMTGKGTFTGTAGNHPIHTESHVDYHWKSANCSPSDINLRARSTR